jgi:hypothetical protein
MVDTLADMNDIDLYLGYKGRGLVFIENATESRSVNIAAWARWYLNIGR